MKIHIVKKGDSLYMIAQKYGVSLEDIVELNPSITNVDMIDVGMKIKIPASKPEDMEIMHQHEVKQGDTLWKLSKAWGVPLSDMIKANPQLKNPNVLLTGEIVNIPKTSTPGQMPHMHDEHHEDAGHHPLHPSSVMQGVQGLMGKMSTAPFIGKKPTGQKPSTMPVPTPVPTPVPMPLPEPAPAPMPVVPVMEKPKTYPIHVEYEKHIDLFQQYGVPATEVMSLYDMPNMPENVSPAMQTHGYGYPMTSPAMSGGYGHPMTSPAMSGGYGYSMPTAVSPAEMGPANWCPPGQVMGSSTLPWGAPAPMPYGPMSGYGMENEMVSPAMMMPQGGGYGQYDQTAVSPAMMMPQGGGYGQYDQTAVSPAMMMPQGGGYGQYDQTAVSPAMMMPQGGGYGQYDQTAVSPAMMMPQGGGYGQYDQTAVSPAMMMPQGGGYGHYDQTAVSPAMMGPYGGYPSATLSQAESPYPSYNYVGNGQVAAQQTTGSGKKPCNCGCHDRDEEEQAEINESVEQSQPAKVAKIRKPAAKPAVRVSRKAQTQQRQKNRGSYPWINR